MDKKRVCIVTYFGSTNYGSNIQAVALGNALKKLNCDVCYIKEFRNKHFMLKHPIMLAARFINRVFESRTKAFFSPVSYTISDNRKGRLKEFANEHFAEVTFEDDAEWKKAREDRMIFAAGSDIIWNPARGYPTKYFLDFAYYAKLPRFSYASSVGALSLPKKYYRAYRKYLGSMKTVGVREQSVANMLEPIIGRSVTKVPDPSMLLTAEEWEQFSKRSSINIDQNSKYVVCYFVMNDPHYWEYVASLHASNDIRIIVLPMHSIDEQQPYEVVSDGTPYEFIHLIKNAEFICTDSFHACVISSIFNRDFYLLKREREAENAKYEDFLGRYRLSDRIVMEKSFTPKEKTDYSYFNEKIEQDRAEAYSFLEKSIS